MGYCPITARIARVDGASWFEQKDMDFPICLRAMLDATGNDNEITFLDSHSAMAELHVEGPSHN